MKLKLIISICTISTLFFACNNVSEKDITVIDELVLGKSNKEFIQQYDTLKIPYTKFLTTSILSNLEEFDQNTIVKAYTKEFNQLLGNSSIEHYGLYNQQAFDGTSNIVQLNVFLGFVSNTLIFNPSGGLVDATKETGIKTFNQALHKDLVVKIEKMLIQKYGEPDKIIKENINFYYYDKNQTKTHNTWNDYNTEQLVWNTNNLEISYFKGINTDSYFNEKFNYMIMIDKSPRKEKLQENDIQVYEYPYISYRLNEKTIKKLKLDIPNI
ncbi:hypothetical protein GJV76_15205 [Myroides sp. BIT-d1]|uniref:Uncharacterized protein n=1 Tax=Myroides albus TaxID=2562892 RepID=A0A6I3LNV6_9FLAO|nr:hypothetical protein [Myroides albus]MTG99447.1 hypothetical protein [Myroides albus]